MKRIKGIKIVFAVLMTVLFCRLFYIQIIGHEAFSEAALRQQTVKLVCVDADRPNLGRNDLALSGMNLICVFKDRDLTKLELYAYADVTGRFIKGLPVIAVQKE